MSTVSGWVVNEFAKWSSISQSHSRNARGHQQTQHLLSSVRLLSNTHTELNRKVEGGETPDEWI